MGRRRKTFAEIVDALGTVERQSSTTPVYSPLTSGEYTGSDGTRWTARGGELGWSRIRHLILDTEVSVVRCYLGEIDEVSEADRVAFLERIKPFLTGGRVPKSERYTDFRALEFKDGQHRSLLVVEEFC